MARLRQLVVRVRVRVRVRVWRACDSSSFRLMSCMPRMSRSLHTVSYSFCCLRRSCLGAGVGFRGRGRTGVRGRAGVRVRVEG